MSVWFKIGNTVEDVEDVEEDVQTVNMCEHYLCRNVQYL